VSGSDNEVLTSDGAGGITSEPNLTFDGTTLGITGDTIEQGNQSLQSCRQTGCVTTTLICRFPFVSGSSATFDYYIYDSGTNAMRSGIVMTVWDGINTTFTDNSTPDLNASTAAVKFFTTITGSDLELYAAIGGGTWDISVGTRIVF
jgi:hypothetical protein